MTTTVIFVNGPPRAGKDTFVELASKHLAKANVWPDSFSSIDPVRDLLTNSAGIDLSAKTPADRKLLADIGAALEEHSNWRTEKVVEFCKNSAWKGAGHGYDTAVFIHIREPQNIQRVIRRLREIGGFRVTTAFVDGPRAVDVDNVADRAIRLMSYDWTLDNDSTIEAFDTVARLWVDQIGFKEVK